METIVWGMAGESEGPARRAGRLSIAELGALGRAQPEAAPYADLEHVAREHVARVPDDAAADEESPDDELPDDRLPDDGLPGEATAPVDEADRASRRAQFEREALAHLDAMYSFALKLARARDDAEDLVSDTVLRAFERWEQYRLGTNIRAWLFTILYHVFVSRKRRIDAREVQPAEDASGWSPHEAVGEVDPERRFYDSFLDDEITRAIDALPDEYRSAVVLSDLHELRYAEIARILRVPEGTVKSRLFRGRRILQRKLAGYAVEMGYFRALPRAV